MSVVAAKVYQDRIEIASDTIVVKGWSKIPNAENKIVKMMKYKELIIGGVGYAEENSLMLHYIKTHTIETMDERGVLDFIIEFKRWKKDLCDNSTISNHYIIAYKGKCFCVEQMLVYEISDFMAIGAGDDFANAAMRMGATPREAVKVSCEMCAMVSEPILCESISR